ncbi:unnamed protein product [Musa acuminata subsp. burmannicoides]
MGDSHTGLPSWMRTGILLCTGLDFSRSGLLSLRFSTRNSYSTPFSASAIRHRCPNVFIKTSSSTTPFGSTSAIARSRSLESPSLPRLIEPAHEGDERDVDEAEGVAGEVLLVPQLALQQLQDPGKLLLGRRMSLTLELPQPFEHMGGIGIRRTHLLVDEVRPEAGMGAGVGVGGQQRCAVGPRLVDVLDDYEGLAHGLAVVDEDGDLLVHGVGLEQERALVPQEVLLLPVLILHPLLRQRDPAPLPERAHPEAQQHHPLRVYLTHRSISLTQLPFSHYASWWQRRPWSLGALYRDARKQKMTMWSPPVS